MRRNPRMLRCLWLVALALLLAACDERIAVSLPEAGPVADWPAWGGGAGGGHFTPLQEIRPDNLAALELVWTHRSGDFRSGPDLNNDAVDLQTTMPASAFQATPIVVEGRLYYCSPFNRVFALDPETGEQLWVHDPGVNMDEHPVTNCRGVSSWVDPDLKPGARCRHRILAPTLDARILALDGETGERCTDFGSSGEIRLTQGMGPHPARAYAVTTPPQSLATRWSQVRLSLTPGIPGFQQAWCVPSICAAARSAGPGIPSRREGRQWMKPVTMFVARLTSGQ